MKIKAYQMEQGDRIAFRSPDGKVISRTVEAVGEGYVVVLLQRTHVRIPERFITSHIRVEAELVERHRQANRRIDNKRRIEARLKEEGGRG